MDRFAACFEELEDPRTGNAALHDFHTLLIIALCTVLCGGQGCVDMALFAKAKEPFLREFLNLKNGPPSHDTFSRLFRRLDPDQFRVAFQRFMTAFSATCQGVIAIDGKVLRRSFDKASDKSALHMVSAWGCELGMVLAQIATDAKSNEITAVPHGLHTGRAPVSMNERICGLRLRDSGRSTRRCSSGWRLLGQGKIIAEAISFEECFRALAGGRLFRRYASRKKHGLPLPLWEGVGGRDRNALT